MISSLFTIQFIVMAVFVNTVVFLISNAIKDIITKGKGTSPNFGLPPVVVRNILMVIVFGISFGLTWGMAKFGQIELLSNSVFFTSAWSAILSILTYEIGLKDIMNGLKGMLKTKIGIKDESMGNSNDKKD